MSNLRAIGWVLLLVCVTGCSKREEKLSTGATIPAVQLPLTGPRGDSIYAVVQSAALPYLYDNFRSVLSSQGLVKWDARFDCNHFSTLYISTAQINYAVAAWHSSTPANSLALAEVWYIPTGRSPHAIVAAQTEQGLLFIEPQTGKVITLSPSERSSIFLAKW